jgi:hypothetical protein
MRIDATPAERFNPRSRADHEKAVTTRQIVEIETERARRCRTRVVEEAQAALDELRVAESP